MAEDLESLDKDALITKLRQVGCTHPSCHFCRTEVDWQSHSGIRIVAVVTVLHVCQECTTWIISTMVALGPVSMMLRCVTVKIAASIDRIGMLRTDCSGETRLALNVPNSS